MPLPMFSRFTLGYGFQLRLVGEIPRWPLCRIRRLELQIEPVDSGHIAANQDRPARRNSSDVRHAVKSLSRTLSLDVVEVLPIVCEQYPHRGRPRFHRVRGERAGENTSGTSSTPSVIIVRLPESSADTTPAFSESGYTSSNAMLVPGKRSEEA